jgi:hypothetical protein
MGMLATLKRRTRWSGGCRSSASALLALVLAVGATACGSSTPPPGEGLVVGGIIPCAALGPPPGVQYAAGTVTVLEGVVTWRNTGPGTSVAVFPTNVEAKQTVMTNASYQFALAPGDYVLQAHFPPPANVTPFVSVTVRSGVTNDVDVPNMCM